LRSVRSKEAGEQESFSDNLARLLQHTQDVQTMNAGEQESSALPQLLVDASQMQQHHRN